MRRFWRVGGFQMGQIRNLRQIQTIFGRKKNRIELVQINDLKTIRNVEPAQPDLGTKTELSRPNVNVETIDLD